MTVAEFDGWADGDWAIVVRRPQEVFDLISHIALAGHDRIYAWRGQRDAAWPLRSALVRRLERADTPISENSLREEEGRILEAARRWGLGRDLGSSATDMHLLAVLQHHGVPTRLIDVTSNPMTAVWFAIEAMAMSSHAETPEPPGVVFAIDVTDTDWYETFQHGWPQKPTYGWLEDPLGDSYNRAHRVSVEKGELFRAFPALPDERMKAQEGFFLGSAFPDEHQVPGVVGLNPLGPAPGCTTLRTLVRDYDELPPGDGISFCAIVIPSDVKAGLRNPLKRTFNRRRRVLFPDVDGFRSAIELNDVD